MGEDSIPEGVKPVGFCSDEWQANKENSWKAPSDFERWATLGFFLCHLSQSCRTAVLFIHLRFYAFSFATSWLQWCLHSSSAVNPWAFEGGFQAQSREKLPLPWEKQQFGLHWAKDRNSLNNTIFVRRGRVFRYLELFKELILGGINCSQSLVTSCPMGSTGQLGCSGHCANPVWLFLKPKVAQKKWMHIQIAETFKFPSLVFTVMQNEPETFKNVQYKKKTNRWFFHYFSTVSDLHSKPCSRDLIWNFSCTKAGAKPQNCLVSSSRRAVEKGRKHLSFSLLLRRIVSKIITALPATTSQKLL